MDANIIYFLKYGSNLKNLTETAKKVRYVDFFFPNKRIINSDFFESMRFRNIRRLIEKNNISFHISVLDSIYLLRYFGATPKIIDDLYDKGYKTIKRVARLDSYEFNFLTKSKSNSKYNRISKAITKYTEWKSENKDILTEIIILDYLRNIQNNVMLENLLIHIKDYFNQNILSFSESGFYKICKDMHKNRLVDLKPSGYIKLHVLSLSEVMSYNFSNDDVFKFYLSGSTFQDIGEMRGVTRSRIQQIFTKAIEALPIMKEDIEYKKIFEIYNFNETDFKRVFNETTEVYNYLNYKYEQGTESVVDYLKDYTYSDEFISDYLYEHGYFINFDNEVLSINLSNLIDYYIYINKDRTFSYEEARVELNSFFEKYSMDGYDSDELRAFKARIEYSKYTVASNDGTFRYFNCEGLDKEQLKLLKDSFDLPDGIYGSQKIYDLNIDVMKELNLRNGEELLDLYKKMDINARSVNKVIRRSEVQIGEKEKYKFIKEILIEFNGEYINEVTWYISDEYGLHQGSIHSYILDKFKHLIVNRKIEIARPKTNIEAIAKYLDKILQNEIYLLREINNLTSENFNESISINNLILKNNHYRVHERHIINERFNSPLEAMKHYIIKHDIFRTPETQLTKDGTFYNARSSLLRNFEIFRVNEKTFINKDKLLQGGIDKEDIFDFIKSIENHQLSSTKYFTIKSILQDGFKHRLLDMGFENIFYEEILRNSSKLGVINTTPVVFYYDEDDKNNLEDFIYHLVDSNYTIDYQDLIDILLDIYGLSYDNSKLNTVLADTPTYYSYETEKFYKNKEQYYLEVYGK